MLTLLIVLGCGPKLLCAWELYTPSGRGLYGDVDLYLDRYLLTSTSTTLGKESLHVDVIRPTTKQE